MNFQTHVEISLMIVRGGGRYRGLAGTAPGQESVRFTDNLREFEFILPLEGLTSDKVAEAIRIERMKRATANNFFEAKPSGEYKPEHMDVVRDLT